jgi:hypothetical protein
LVDDALCLFLQCIHAYNKWFSSAEPFRSAPSVR